MRSLLTCAALLLTTEALSAGEQPVKIDVQEDQAVVTIGGEEFAVYNFGKDLPKPYFSPVRAPGGAIVTRSLEKPEDHPHHKGIWLAIDDVSGIRFWAEKGRIQNQSVEVLEPVGDAARMQVVNNWIETVDNKPVLVETTEITIFPNRLVVFDIQFAADDRKVVFGDTKEGGFGIRLPNSMREKEGGHVLNAEGLKGTKEAWGQRSKWVDYYGPVDGKTYGVALLDHPDNFRPSRFHVRDYGLFTLSPFGESAYTGGKSEPAPVEVLPGKTLRLRYGIYIHSGDAEEGEVAKVYQQFLKATKGPEQEDTGK